MNKYYYEGKTKEQPLGSGLKHSGSYPAGRL